MADIKDEKFFKMNFVVQNISRIKKVIYEREF